MTNTNKQENSEVTGLGLVKGQEMGGFQLGSTVVLVFEAPSIKTGDAQQPGEGTAASGFMVKAGDVVRVGQKLFQV